MRRRQFNCLAFTVAASAFFLFGCEKKPTARDYKGVVGTIVTLNAETSTITLDRQNILPTDPWDETKLVCVLDDDCEIFVNDKVSAFEEIRPSDEAELLGYRIAEKPNLLLVNQAYITREQPAPDQPDLSPPATQPTPRQSLKEE